MNRILLGLNFTCICCLDMCPLVIMEKLLGQYYSSEELKSLEEILQKPPLYTTIRVNILKCTKEDVKIMLENHFKSNQEAFIIEENYDFPDVLMIKALGPNNVEPAAKGKLMHYKYILIIFDFRNHCRLFQWYFSSSWCRFICCWNNWNG